MRIIAGKLKGRRFSVPQSIHLRPTTDRSKENLFNSLHFKIDWENTTVLDLYSGTGNIAFEFHSRGCPYVHSVDKNQKYIDYQKKLAVNWTIEGMYFTKANAIQFIRSVTQRFNIVFADPPYTSPDLKILVDTIIAEDILKEDGMIIVEHDISSDFCEHLRFEKQYKYGQTIFSTFR